MTREFLRRFAVTGMRFRKPARFVIDLGRGEYVLSAADGEVLDLVCLK